MGLMATTRRTASTVIDLDEMIPEQGDTVTIINCGTHLEVVQHKVCVGMELTEEDMQAIRSGEVTWN